MQNVLKLNYMYNQSKKAVTISLCNKYVLEYETKTFSLSWDKYRVVTITIKTICISKHVFFRNTNNKGATWMSLETNACQCFRRQKQIDCFWFEHFSIDTSYYDKKLNMMVT